MNGSSSRRQADDEGDGIASGHVSLSDAIIAIKNLDRHAFARRRALGHDAGEQQAKQKILRVSDVVAAQSERSQPPSRFSRLSGAGQLHRERARQRKQAAAYRSGQADNTKADAQRSLSYRPLSLAHLLRRLSTFSIATYSASKPDSAPALTPLGMAMKGWSHGAEQQRDGVQCDTCSACWTVTLPTTTTKAEQEAAWRELELRVETEHQGWCPWRIRSCEASLYRVAIRSLPELQAEISSVASELAASDGIDKVAVTTDIPPADLGTLSARFPSIPLPALMLALLGWQLTERCRSVQQSIVTCRMCARRAGLWGYAASPDTDAATPSKTFDAVREHKSYCPIVNGNVQSGRWLASHKDTIATSTPLPAYKINANILLSSRRSGQGPTPSTGNATAEHDTRSMRSHEIISKVKGLLDGKAVS